MRSRACQALIDNLEHNFSVRIL